MQSVLCAEVGDRKRLFFGIDPAVLHIVLEQGMYIFVFFHKSFILCQSNKLFFGKCIEHFNRVVAALFPQIGIDKFKKIFSPRIPCPPKVECYIT